MGKFIPDRDYVNEIPTEKRIRELCEAYYTNIHAFETKDNKAAGKRARQNLIELYHLCRVRRKEILARQKQILPIKWESEDG